MRVGVGSAQGWGWGPADSRVPSQTSPFLAREWQLPRTPGPTSPPCTWGVGVGEANTAGRLEQGWSSLGSEVPAQPGRRQDSESVLLLSALPRVRGVGWRAGRFRSSCRPRRARRGHGVPRGPAREGGLRRDYAGLREGEDVPGLRSDSGHSQRGTRGRGDAARESIQASLWTGRKPFLSSMQMSSDFKLATVLEGG